MMRAAVLGVLLSMLPVFVPAHAAPIDPFAGDWRGVAIETKAHDDLGPADLDLRIVPDQNGFSLRWTAFEGILGDGDLDRERFNARFAPSGRPGVYAYDDRQQSLLSRMFASPATGNPLEGETLLWGRIEEQALVAYALHLKDDGDFELHRVEVTRVGEELALERSIRTGHQRITILAGRLARAEN